MASFPGPTFKLFVYGTLMRGGCRHHALADQTYLGPAVTRPLYLLYHLGDHPGMVRAETEGQSVQGELYEVETERLAQLNELEGAPDWFCLSPVELEGWEPPIHSYFYQQANPGLPLCPTGRWSTE